MTAYYDFEGEGDDRFDDPAGAFADDTLRTFAAALGLDEGDFNNCLGSNRYRNEINAGIVEAQVKKRHLTLLIRIKNLLTEEQILSVLDPAKMAGPMRE